MADRAPIPSIAEPGRLAWIFGSSRSGSTWLLRMLAGLERVVPIDDPHIGHHLGIWRPIPLAWAAAEEEPPLGLLNDYKREKPDFFFSDEYRDAWMPPLRELICARFQAQAGDQLAREPGERPTDPLVVVKEPGSQVADLLLELFPDAGLIFLLRDGRDVVDSWLDAHSSGSWATGEGAFPIADEGRESLIRWQSNVWLYRTGVVQRAYAAHDPRRRILVRYEEMRDDPASALSEICAVLGIDAAAPALREIADEHSYKRVPEGRKGSGREIRHAEPGHWAQAMTSSEIEIMHEVMGEKLAQLAYRVEHAVASQNPR